MPRCLVDRKTDNKHKPIPIAPMTYLVKVMTLGLFIKEMLKIFKIRVILRYSSTNYFSFFFTYAHAHKNIATKRPPPIFNNKG